MKNKLRLSLIIGICLIVFTATVGCKPKREANPGKEPKRSFVPQMSQGSFRMNMVASGKQTLVVQGHKQDQSVYTEMASSFHFPPNTDNTIKEGTYDLEHVLMKVGGFVVDSNEELPKPDRSQSSWVSPMNPFSQPPSSAFDQGEARRKKIKSSILTLTKKLCETPFEFEVLQDNSIAITQQPEYSELLDSASSEIKPHLVTIVDSCSKVAIKEYLKMVGNLFPDTKIGVGAIWQKTIPGEGLLSDQFSNDILFDCEYELVSMDQESAIINLRCKKNDSTTRKVVYNKQDVTITSMSWTITGKITYDINGQMIEKMESESQTSGTFVIPGQGSFKTTALLKSTACIDRI